MSQRPTEKMILIMLIGLMFSILIIFAGTRGILIDAIATQLDVEVWEIAHIMYFIFIIIGVSYAMLNDRGRFTPADFQDIVLVVLISLISYTALNVINIGSISGGVTAMVTENIGWSTIYTLIITVYMASKFMKR
jgi:hypothetical protein